jgi:hypothetical protein
MKQYLPLLLTILLLAAHPVDAARAEKGVGDEADNSRKIDGPDHGWRKNMKGSCSQEMRGRCGKRRGDWYGAGRPVASAVEARKLLMDYFSGQGYTVSETSEGTGGFRAEITGTDGKLIDRVMIDQRSGRSRSIY